ncbi:MAG TPA: hypothetical protein VIQ74_02450 [Gemmatimonadaceae bacterium]|jgi:hypothetical protein
MHSLDAQTLRRSGGDAVVVDTPLRQPADDRPAAQWRWTGTVPEGGTIELRLIRGSLRAHTVEGSEAEVALVRRGIHSDPASVRITVDTTTAGIRIEDRYPPVSRMTQYRECLPPDDGRGDFWHNDVRLETIVSLPADTRLVVHLMDGDIDVRAIDGPRDVSTNQGIVKGVAHLP